MEDVVEIRTRPTRGWVVSLTATSLFALALVVASLWGEVRPMGLVWAITLGGYGVWTALDERARNRGRALVLRIDGHGISTASGRRLPWDDVHSLRLRPGPRLWPAPRPRLVVVDGAQAGFARRAGSRPESHQVPLWNLSLEPDEIVHALRRHAPERLHDALPRGAGRR
ncbi:hypothetical protein GC722_16735 [Auraticoccus sp. F435]|uniref:PH domain-containing protein n=1 Tax=Auraticoccus cholistanensis TaxID=2656650 RepID=A0A6A9V221_9ACTN|nr:hypothetical protein [Auraticoccus cholistanensis]MVA77648.1 hypothetical protein [Auraticoccus cholistanensis]